MSEATIKTEALHWTDCGQRRTDPSGVVVFLTACDQWVLLGQTTAFTNLSMTCLGCVTAVYGLPMNNTHGETT